MKYTSIAFLRILASIFVGVIVGIIAHFTDFPLIVDLQLGWVSFGLSYLIQSLVSFAKIPSHGISDRAKDEDLGIWLQFGLMITACSTALFTLIIWSKNKDAGTANSILSGILFIGSVALAWIIVHLSFTYRYAHLYYGDNNEKYSKHIKGLDFPDEKAPDYFDFAYYSFTIGMTFQVSDVTVRTKGLRRLTLIHSLVSFLFNTILIALTINEIINL